MPHYQLHIVKAKDGENVRQPIVQAEDEGDARRLKLKRGEAIAAVSEVNGPALAAEYPDGHPFEETL